MAVEAQTARRSLAGDIIVFLSMITVAAALMVGLVMEFKVAPAMAAAFAALALVTALTGHMLLRRSEGVAGASQGSRAGHAEVGREPAFAVEDDEDEVFMPRPRHEPSLAAHAEQSSVSADGASIEPDGQDNQGLARLRLAPLKVPRQADGDDARHGVSGAAELEGIIRRLASDIESGRDPQPGVSAVRAEVPQRLTEQDFDLPAPPAPGPLPHQMEAPPQVEEPAGLDAADKLAAVAAALSKEQIDVFLEPIHGLADRQARHYEVIIRLSLDNGVQLGMADYSEATSGTALLPLIDAVKVSQAKKVGMHLLRRGQSGALISDINGESVSAAEFSDDLATIMGRDQIMAGRLVLSFSQSDLRAFTPAQWARIDRLGRLGFRFSIGEITNLDMDFELLARKGFGFAKLDAAVFLKGLPAGEVVIPPTDVCRHLAGAGLTLVVDRVNDDRLLAEVLGFGALFGKGALFGAPRPVKVEALAAPAAPPLASRTEMR
jgi:cyclic-di-GMP phosphodiesterase TipF (flagellum assembly factor)